MKKLTVFLLTCAIGICVVTAPAMGQGSSIAPYITQYWRSVLGFDTPVHQPIAGDSVTFYQIKDAAGNVIFTVDSSDETVGVGASNAAYNFQVADTGDAKVRILADSANSGSGQEAGLYFAVDGGSTVFSLIHVNEESGAPDNQNLQWQFAGADIMKYNRRGKFTQTALMANPTGNEYAYILNYTTNKASSGNDTGLRIAHTDTASPGTSYLINALLSTTSKFYVKNDGTGYFAGNLGLNEPDPETLLELTHATPTITGHISTHNDDADSGMWTLVGKREDGAGTETETGWIKMAHDGAGLNDQLEYIEFGRNTGAGVVEVMILGLGGVSTINDPNTLGVGATTFIIESNVMTMTGDGGGNTVATITGADSGTLLTLIFADGNVTITDTDAHTANTIDLAGAATNLTSADDTTLQIVFDGTSWYETSRSVN